MSTARSAGKKASELKEVTKPTSRALILALNAYLNPITFQLDPLELINELRKEGAAHLSADEVKSIINAAREIKLFADNRLLGDAALSELESHQRVSVHIKMQDFFSKNSAILEKINIARKAITPGVNNKTRPFKGFNSAGNATTCDTKEYSRDFSRSLIALKSFITQLPLNDSKLKEVDLAQVLLSLETKRRVGDSKEKYIAVVLDLVENVFKGRILAEKNRPILMEEIQAAAAKSASVAVPAAPSASSVAAGAGAAATDTTSASDASVAAITNTSAAVTIADVATAASTSASVPTPISAQAPVAPASSTSSVTLTSSASAGSTAVVQPVVPDATITTSSSAGGAGAMPSAAPNSVAAQIPAVHAASAAAGTGAAKTMTEKDCLERGILAFVKNTIYYTSSSTLEEEKRKLINDFTTKISESRFDKVRESLIQIVRDNPNLTNEFLYTEIRNNRPLNNDLHKIYQDIRGFKSTTTAGSHAVALPAIPSVTANTTASGATTNGAGFSTTPAVNKDFERGVSNFLLATMEFALTHFDDSERKSFNQKFQATVRTNQKLSQELSTYAASKTDDALLQEILTSSIADELEPIREKVAEEYYLNRGILAFLEDQTSYKFSLDLKVKSQFIDNFKTKILADKLLSGQLLNAVNRAIIKPGNKCNICEEIRSVKFKKTDTSSELTNLSDELNSVFTVVQTEIASASVTAAVPSPTRKTVRFADSAESRALNGPATTGATVVPPAVTPVATPPGGGSSPVSLDEEEDTAFTGADAADLAKGAPGGFAAAPSIVLSLETYITQLKESAEKVLKNNFFNKFTITYDEGKSIAHVCLAIASGKSEPAEPITFIEENGVRKAKVSTEHKNALEAFLAMHVNDKGIILITNYENKGQQEQDMQVLAEALEALRTSSGQAHLKLHFDGPQADATKSAFMAANASNTNVNDLVYVGAKVVAKVARLPNGGINGGPAIGPSHT